MALVLDTGPIVALIDAEDPAHDACLAMVDNIDEQLVIPSVVLVEVDYWLHKFFDSAVWRSLVADITNGAYRLHQLDEHGLGRAAELHRQYPKLDLGLVDAAVIACCEQLGETKVATLDRRDFSVVRPKHCDNLKLLPA